MGYTAFAAADYYHALQWLLITKDKMDRENGTALEKQRSFTLSMLYDYISYSMHDRKNPEHALWYSRALNAIGKLKTFFFNHAIASRVHYVW